MPHRHAQSVTVTGVGCADPDAVMDFVEDLPAGVYRVKGTVQVAAGSSRRRFVVQAVGPNVYVSEASGQSGDLQGASSVLVAIGEDFDAEAVRSALTRALSPDADHEVGDDRTERLLHHVRLHS